MERLTDLKRFYELLDTLKGKGGGYLYLKDCHGKTKLPTHGVYFFFENGEQRTDSGEGLRVVRVGTHAVSTGSKTTLWNRLSQHKGVAKTGGGNHRGSVFRKLIGKALLSKGKYLPCLNWGIGSSPTPEIKNAEHFMEQIVSTEIGKMPFVCLPVYDIASPESQRVYIEKNAIALLSNYNKKREECLDPASKNWIGLYSDCEKVQGSGLWNSKHVADSCDSNFLNIFEQFVNQI